MAGKLTQAQKQQLQTWIGTGPKSFELLYSFTKDDSSAATFHAKCANQGPTVTVIYNILDTIYGGYTAVSWRTTSGTWYQDKNAFLFRLQHNGKSACVQFPIAKNFGNAIYDNQRNGPTFGKAIVWIGWAERESHELLTFTGTLSSDKGVYMLNGVNNFGQTYATKGLDSVDITNGIQTVTDLEVYKVTENLIMEDWRSTPDWSSEVLEELKSDIRAFCPPACRDTRYANILLIGPINAGKSSFFNTISSVFKGSLSSQACCGSAEKSITTTFRTYQVRDREADKDLPFRLCDTMGLEVEDMLDEQELHYLLDGNILDGYKHGDIQKREQKKQSKMYNVKKLLSSKQPSTTEQKVPGFRQQPTANSKMHCVCFVLDGSTAPVMSDKMMQNIKYIQRIVRDKGVPHLFLITKVDKVCPKVNEKLTNIFCSKGVYDLVENIAAQFGVPRRLVVPMKNFENEDEVSLEISVLALLSLKFMLNCAEEFLSDVNDRDAATNASDELI